MSDITKQLIQEFKLKPQHVENTIELIDGGNTIPFIARYRKEMTGEMNDQVLRELHERLLYLRNLDTRKDDVRRLIDAQGKLTDELTSALVNAKSLQEIEDIYRPYKQKRRTRASIAKERGLEPLALIIFEQSIRDGIIDEIVLPFINAEMEVNTIEDALNGAMDIIAEDISDNAEYRKFIRQMFFKQGMLVSKAKKEEDSVYRMYYDFRKSVV